MKELPKIRWPLKLNTYYASAPEAEMYITHSTALDAHSKSTYPQVKPFGKNHNTSDEMWRMYYHAQPMRSIKLDGPAETIERVWASARGDELMESYFAEILFKTTA